MTNHSKSSHNLSGEDSANQSVLNVQSMTTKPWQLRPLDFFDYSLMFILLFGLVGNVLSIIVMRSRRLRGTNAFRFIIAMAVSDTIMLLFKNMSNFLKIYMVNVYNFCIFINIIPEVALFVSVWLIVIMSLERVVAILYPFKVVFIFSKKRCLIFIAVIILFFNCLSSIGLKCFHYSAKKPYYCEIKGGLDGNCFYYYRSIFPWIKSLLGFLLPGILIIFLNTTIILSLNHASTKRQQITNNYHMRRNQNKLTNPGATVLLSVQMDELINNLSSHDNELSVVYECKSVNNSIHGRNKSASQLSSKALLNKERQATFMLLTISFLFVILSFPYYAFDFLRKLNFNYEWLKTRHVSRLIYLLIDLNHATNIICYFITSKRFRDEIKRLLNCRCRRAAQHTNVMAKFKT